MQGIAEAFDYLVVSDLHLRGGFQDAAEGLYHFDEEFADFLRYHRLKRVPDRPWVLIICGDFIEFHYVTDLPDANAPLLRGVSFSEAERRYGASTEAPKSRWKLDTILRSCHPQLLLALARFLVAGNHIIIVRGNHDVEMVWPEVQEHFRKLIAEHYPADASYMAMKEVVTQRLHFAPWFWYVPGKLYAEHGCQYDTFCSFEHFLHPVVPGHPTRIENSISDLSIRYFANQTKAQDAMAAENIKSVTAYVGWMVRGNLFFIPRAARLYAGMVRRILAKCGRRDTEAEREVREEHERRLAGADGILGLPPGSTRWVDALHARPAMRRPWFAARFLGLDLFIGGALFLAAAIWTSVAYPARIALWALLGTAAVIALLVHVGVLRVRRIFEYGALHHIADALAQRFDVPYVIFGHSHQAGTWPLANGATYFNIGTWVPMPKHAYFVYFVVTGDGPMQQAGLWRWNKDEQQPEPFQGRSR